jgi:hypothetical protein
MAYEWKFYLKQPTDTIRNPTAGEFFSTDAVADVAEAMVRESIQNTLDARQKLADGSRQPASVRFYLSELSGALSPARASHWFSSLWPHVMASGNGLRSQPTTDETCPFLVIEDFGTTGLTGNPRAHDQVEGETNHFLRFFRGEGLSGNDDEKTLGSWGVGKTVFPLSSRISSFFGFTVRSDDNRQLLLGRSILKYHRVSQQSYKSDGYFGQGQTDGFMLPCDDRAVLDEFRSDFRIKRLAETGLSIVVPWYEIDGEDGMTRDKVISAVLRGFFYPILMGHLAVTVASPSGEIALDSGSIMRQVDSIGGHLSQELLPILELAEWARTRLDPEFQSLRPPTTDQSQKWSPEIVPEAVIQNVRQSLAQRQRIALRVPMHVHPKNNSPQPTFFHVFLEHSDKDNEKPVFIRDELIIPRAGARSVSHVRAIFIAEDRPIAMLLRDAEKPAHDEWSTKTSNFKDKYLFGIGAIKFVRYSVSELLRIVNQAEQKPDPSITIEFFSVPAEPEDQDAMQTRLRRPLPTKGKGPTESPPPPPPPRPRRFRIDKMRGGFSIRPGDPEAPLPVYIDVRVAYDVRRGNPLKKYFPTDFDLSKAPIHWEAPGNRIDVMKADINRMLVKVNHKDFQLYVTGFDTDRELYVKADAKETTDD